MKKPRGMTPSAWAEKQRLRDSIAKLDLPHGVKAIPLTKGLYTLVDEQDYDFLMQWEWHARVSRGGPTYATRTEYIRLKNGKRVSRAIKMHNVILPSPEGKETDHISGDGLNNQRSNLRPGTHQQNMWNRKPVAGSSSKFKGVSYQKATNYWKAYIKINKKQKHLGCYWNEEDAARAYNRAAINLHGEFAKLNLVEDGPCPTLIVR